MNAQRMVSVALKLIGIFLLVNSLNHLTLLTQSAFLFSRSQSSGTDVVILALSVIGAPVVYLIACLGIIVKSEALARKFVQPDETFATAGISVEAVQTIAFCVVGLITIMNGLPGVARYFTNYYTHRHQMVHGAGVAFPFHQYGNLVASVIQLVVGVALFFQAKGLVGLWKRLQTTTRVKQS